MAVKTGFSYGICLITCLERSLGPTQASLRLFAELASNLSCPYISHCGFPSLQVLRLIRPLPATLQLQLLAQGSHCTRKGQEFSPTCDKRSPSSPRISQETPALPRNTPAFLLDTYTAPLPSSLLFCSPSAAACRSHNGDHLHSQRRGLSCHSPHVQTLPL